MTRMARWGVMSCWRIPALLAGIFSLTAFLTARSVEAQRVDPARAGGFPAASGVTEYEEGLLDLDELLHPREPAAPGSQGAGGPSGTVTAGVGSSAASAAPLPLPGAAARTAGVESLRRGAGFLTDGRAEAAVAEFDRVATSIPLLADWADVLAARALAGAGDVTGARSRAARAGIDGAGEWAWRAEYAALILTADSSAALLLAERAAEVSSTAAERAYASARAGTLRAARQDETGALAAFRAAMQAAPGAQGALDAARGAANLSNLTPDDQLLVGRTLLANDGRDRGIPLLEAYASSPGVSAADRAAVRLEAGRILFDARDYTHAERNLRLAAEQLPAAAYQLGRTEYRLGRTAEGLKTFQRVGESFPNTAAAADAWFVLGDLAHDEGRVSEAADYYRKAITTGAHTTSAADALARLIGISLMANAPARAVADADLYFARRPVDQTSAPGVYWAGRALLAAGRRAEAEARFAEVLDVYPFSWYGSLAARRLGRTLGDLRIAPPPALTVERTRMVEAAFFRIDALREAGLTAEASLELARLRETVAADDGALYLVAEAMAAQGQSVQGALLGRQIQEHRGVWDDRLLRIVYPFPFRDDVVRYAGRNGLDPYAVAGLIRQESFFNPNAVSAAGAMGLMQVMPQTATGLARTAGIQGFRSSMLRDPTVNIRLGTLFLADQMKSWNGRLSAVLGAYNGGPTRVARWNTFPEREDDEIWVERIPLAETRDYVKRVTLYGEIYRRLYSSTN